MNYLLSDEDLQFNNNLDPIESLQRLGFTENSYYVEEKIIRLFCPIHKDQIRRSLLIDRANNTYKCSYASCLGHKGGTLLEFYAQYLGIPVPEAIAHIKGGQFAEKDLSLIADELIHSGALYEALPVLQKAIVERPNNGTIKCKLAALLLEMGRKEEGIEKYFKAAEDFGICGELDKTLNIYNILIILGPGNIKVRRHLSYLYSRLKRSDAAAEQLKWVVDSLLKKGIVEEAKETCEEIIELAPKEAYGYKMLGNILMRIGLLSDGVRQIEKAANIYLEKGEKESAIETVKIGLAVYPDKPSLMEILKRADEVQETVREKSEQELAQEQEFMDWIESVTSTLTEAPIQNATPVPSDTTEVSPTDRRVAMIKNEINALDSDEKIESMKKQLVQMFQDVKKTFEDGCLETWEMKIIKEFYKAFCIALEQHSKEQEN